MAEVGDRRIAVSRRGRFDWSASPQTYATAFDKPDEWVPAVWVDNGSRVPRKSNKTVWFKGWFRWSVVLRAKRVHAREIRKLEREERKRGVARWYAEQREQYVPYEDARVVGEDLEAVLRMVGALVLFALLLLALALWGDQLGLV